MRTLIALLVGLLLVGCASTNVDQQMALACSNYNSAGRVAVVFYEEMSDPQLLVVDSAKALISPICKSWGTGEVIATSELVLAINTSLAEMLIVTRSHQP